MTDLTMSGVELQRETVTTPLDWNDDPFGDGVNGSERGRDDLEPVSFMGDNNEASFPGGDLPDDMLEGNSRLRNETSRDNGLGGSSNQNSSDSTDSDIFGTPFSDPNLKNERAENKRSRETAPTGTSLSNRRKKKPKGMPKRPLSAYNLYFQSERAKILEAAENGEGGKIGFEGLGKIIGSKWRVLPASERKQYDKLADKDSTRYRKEMKEYNQKKHKRMEDSEQLSYENLLRSSGASPVPPSALHQAGVVEALSSTVGQPVVDYLRTGTVPVPPLSAVMRDVPSSQRRTEVDGYASPRNPSREQLTENDPRGYQQEYPPLSPNSRRRQLKHPHHQFGADFGMVAPSRHAAMTPPSQYAPHPEALMSFPPLPQQGAEQVVLPPNQLPVPPGMEIVLPDRNGIDRKYRIQYSCFSMSKQAAHQYVESLSGSRHGAPSSSSTW